MGGRGSGPTGGRGVKVRYRNNDEDRQLLDLMRKGMTLDEIGFVVHRSGRRVRELIVNALYRERIAILEGQLAVAQAEAETAVDILHGLPMARRQA